jgi:hypothetical protein
MQNQEIDINWPDQQKEMVYLGRNGSGIMAGISIFGVSNRVSIHPINSKGNLARCFIEIPKDRVPDIIKALQDSISKD